MLENIGALPLLQKLKLESEEQFPSLKFLELKWCPLVSWIAESSHFPCLEKLRLYALKELEEIPCEIGEIPTMQAIHLEYCSESVVESAKTIAEEQDELQQQQQSSTTEPSKISRFAYADVTFYQALLRDILEETNRKPGRLNLTFREY